MIQSGGQVPPAPGAGAQGRQPLTSLHGDMAKYGVPQAQQGQPTQQLTPQQMQQMQMQQMQQQQMQQMQQAQMQQQKQLPQQPGQQPIPRPNKNGSGIEF